MAYITNRKARHTYEIIDTIEAGMSLLGTEVKSVRGGRGSLIGAQVVIRGGEVLLAGANIPPYQEKNMKGEYNPKRTRKLLLTKRQIQKLEARTESKSLTLIPLSVYNRNKVLKVDVGIARKKNVRDKKEELKKRDLDRAIRKGEY